MKTFRELIAWELEQDRKQKRADSTDNNGARLSAMMMRKLKYLNSSSDSGRDFPQNYEAA